MAAIGQIWLVNFYVDGDPNILNFSGCVMEFCFSDGKYYETVKANFERADRKSVVRTIVNCKVSIAYMLNFYNDLMFN